MASEIDEHNNIKDKLKEGQRNKEFGKEKESLNYYVKNEDEIKEIQKEFKKLDL